MASASLSGRWPAFTELLDVLAEAVTIRDRDGNIAYANRAALRSMGFNSLEELQATLPALDHGRLRGRGRARQPAHHERRPFDAAACAARGRVAADAHRQPRTGESRWRQLKTTPLATRTAS